MASNRAIRFQELYSRRPDELRFDVTVIRDGAWVGGGAGGLETAEAEKAWRALLAQVDAMVQPVLRGLPNFAAGGAEVESVGFVLSHPGAPVQQWHPDEARTAGLVTVFVPLVDFGDAH